VIRKFTYERGRAKKKVKKVNMVDLYARMNIEFLNQVRPP
jgi:hypothetical protein